MKRALLALRQLDRQLLKMKEQYRYFVPKQGWIKTVRKSLGLTLAQMAKRMGLNSSRIVRLEHDEIEGRVTLRSLQAVANSLDCSLVYAFVPNVGLEEFLKKQARKLALEQLKQTAHTMGLEAQSVDEEWLKSQLKEINRRVITKKLEVFMAKLKLEYPSGAMPLDPDEMDGLIPSHITTQGQLNEWEQANILEAEKWIGDIASTIEFGNAINFNISFDLTYG